MRTLANHIIREIEKNTDIREVEHRDFIDSLKTINAAERSVFKSLRVTQDDTIHYFLFSSVDDIVGACTVSIDSSIDPNQYEEAYICDFEVFKSYRGSGYGSTLYKLLEDTMIRRYKTRHITLTYRDQKARKFWLHVGFEDDNPGVSKIMSKSI